MTKFVLADLEGMTKLGAITLDKTAALLFRFETQEQAESFATLLGKSVDEGHVEFELELVSRNTVQ